MPAEPTPLPDGLDAIATDGVAATVPPAESSTPDGSTAPTEQPSAVDQKEEADRQAWRDSMDKMRVSTETLGTYFVVLGEGNRRVVILLEPSISHDETKATFVAITENGPVSFEAVQDRHGLGGYSSEGVFNSTSMVNTLRSIATNKEAYYRNVNGNPDIAGWYSDPNPSSPGEINLGLGGSFKPIKASFLSGDEGKNTLSHALRKSKEKAIPSTKAVDDEKIARHQASIDFARGFMGEIDSPPPPPTVSPTTNP